MKLPKRGEASQSLEAMLISLEEDGRVYLKFDGLSELIEEAGSSSGMKSLAERVKLIKEATFQELTVQVAVPSEVGYQRYIDVLNCLAGAGVAQVGLVDYQED